MNIYLIGFALLLMACNGNENTLENKQPPIDKAAAKKETIERVKIIPLGNISNADLDLAKKGIEDFFKLLVVLDKRAPLSSDLKNSAKGRYVADKILTKFNSKENIIVLTDVDIVTKNKEDNIDEYGIFGLGYRPGNVCVVSTFRLKGLQKSSMRVGREKFEERLKKVCIHEIGHNLGLDHCTKDPLCLMQAAEGTIAQVDKERMDFCTSCKSILQKRN
ncbi:MAG: zinc-dependent metalloprotease family protein [Bacteroidia bacterium]|jgi:archaemetzincin